MSDRETTSRHARSPGWPRWLVLAGVAAAIVGGVLYLTREDPRRLLAEGRAVLEHDPAAAERVLARSVAAAEGDFPEAQLLQCRALAALGQWPAALGGFSLIRRPESCPQEDLWLLGRAAFGQGEFHLADLCLLAARREGPHQAEVLRLLLPRHIELERLEDAQADARTLAALDPDDSFPWRMMALAHVRERNTTAAIADYREALRRQAPPRERRAMQLELLDQLLEAGDIAGARQALDALRPEPRPTADVLRRSAQVLRLEGAAAEALAEIDRAVALRRNDAPSLLLRASLLQDEGRVEEAAADLRAVVRLDPLHRDAHYRLSQVCRSLGRTDEADEHQRIARELSEALARIAELRHALRLDYGNRELTRELAEQLDRVGREDEAEALRRGLPQ